MKNDLKLVSKLGLAVLFLFLSGADFSYGQNEVAGADFSAMFGDSNDSQEPLFIKSDSLSLDAEKRTFTYKGNVKVKRGDVEITADRVVGKYNDKNEIHTVVCEDNIVVTKGEAMRANANRAVYTVDDAKIVLSEAPELARDGNLLSADKIIIFTKEDRSEAEGNVRVKVLPEEKGDQAKEVLIDKPF